LAPIVPIGNRNEAQGQQDAEPLENTRSSKSVIGHNKTSVFDTFSIPNEVMVIYLPIDKQVSSSNIPLSFANKRKFQRKLPS
jgi:hypothetical protein